MGGVGLKIYLEELGSGRRRDFHLQEELKEMDVMKGRPVDLVLGKFCLVTSIL